jgi:molybdenum cofactor synthesis domain-containing protein
MIPLAEAQAHVRSRVRRLDAVTVPLSDALGLVLAEDVLTDGPVPPFESSAVDGFAVRSADVDRVGAELPVSGTVLAGDPGDAPLAHGTAVRIMTGAPVPPGADAIVMVEDTGVRSRDGAVGGVASAASATEVVRIDRVPDPGAFVRPAGDDLASGVVAVPAGTELGPAQLGLVATAGRGEVTVVRRPVAGVLSTGDELVGPGTALRRGQVRDSNRVQLLAACRASGFEAVDLGCVADDASAIEGALRRGVERCDAVLTSGGVSMGEVDLVRVVLERLGELRWMQVAIRPAKPFAFGVVDGVPVFGLAGNPVSSLVGFELHARPALRLMAGHAAAERRRLPAVAPDGLPRRPDGKVHFVRVTLARAAPAGGAVGDAAADDATVGVTPSLEARSAGGQGSHQLSALAAADGLAVVPDGEGIVPGGVVDVIPLD